MAQVPPLPMTVGALGDKHICST